MITLPRARSCLYCLFSLCSNVKPVVDSLSLALCSVWSVCGKAVRHSYTWIRLPNQAVAGFTLGVGPGRSFQQRSSVKCRLSRPRLLSHASCTLIFVAGRGPATQNSVRNLGTFET